jgi:tripartite-type tricarboxylate transporter receptor subunit TctC
MTMKPLSFKRFINRLHMSFFTGAVVLAAATVAAPASAEDKPLDWPKAPVTFIAPFSPGGGGDTLVRLYANQMSKVLGTTIIVENRPGAGGNIGTAVAAKATPDASTLVFGTTGTMGTNHALYQKPGFSIDDFDPIAIFGTTSLSFVVSKNSGFGSVKEIIEHAKKNPKKLTCATAGNGTISHIACAMFQQMANIEVEAIPYRSGSQAVMDLRTDRVSFLIDVIPYLVPHIKDGAIRPLAVTMAKRVPALPDTPTMSEAGVPGYEVFTWDGVFTRKGAPVERLDKLHATVTKVTSDSEFRRTMQDRGTVLETMSRKEFAELVKKEHVRMVSFTKKLGITIE